MHLLGTERYKDGRQDWSNLLQAMCTWTGPHRQQRPERFFRVNVQQSSQLYLKEKVNSSQYFLEEKQRAKGHSKGKNTLVSLVLKEYTPRPSVEN